jgi:hypothetical protein
MVSLNVPNLIGGVFAIVALHRLYLRYQEYQVFLYAILVDLDTDRTQADTLFALKYGCLPPNRLINEMTLGVDVLHQIWEANSDSRLIELFIWHFRR